MKVNTSQKPDVDKAKNIICALIHHEGGHFAGKTRLNKAFWRAHVYHYRKNAGLLSKYPLARLPEGPGVDDLDELLFDIERDGRIKITEKPAGDFLQTILSLTSNPPRLREDEEAAIMDAIRWVKNKSATSVSKESHLLSLAWQKHGNGDIIDVQFDALDADDLKRIKLESKAISRNVAWAAAAVGNIFGE